MLCSCHLPSDLISPGLDSTAQGHAIANIIWTTRCSPWTPNPQHRMPHQHHQTQTNTHTCKTNTAGQKRANSDSKVLQANPSPDITPETMTQTIMTAIVIPENVPVITTVTTTAAPNAIGPSAPPPTRTQTNNNPAACPRTQPSENPFLTRWPTTRAQITGRLSTASRSTRTRTRLSRAARVASSSR